MEPTTDTFMKKNPIPGFYKSANHIVTYTGKNIDIVKGITPDDVCIEDIAHSLAHQCRFAGHTSRFYSVAEHCIYVACFADNLFRPYYMLHDGHEAYYQDIITPLKSFIVNVCVPFKGLMNIADQSIMKAFDLDYNKYINLKTDIKRADQFVFEMEVDVLFKGIDPKKLIQEGDPMEGATFGMRPEEAEAVFLEQWRMLME